MWSSILVNQWPTPAGMTIMSPARKWCSTPLLMEEPFPPRAVQQFDGAIVGGAGFEVDDVGAGDEGGFPVENVIDLADLMVLGDGLVGGLVELVR